MRVKDVADLAGTSVRAVRYYHQLGLLAVPPQGTSWREYGFTHLARLMRIRWLVDAGVPLTEVQSLLSGSNPSDDPTDQDQVADDLDAVIDSIDARIATLRQQRSQIAALAGRVRTGGRLTSLPPHIEVMYQRLLSRPMAEQTAADIRRERELLELACYRFALPADLTVIVDGLTDDDIDWLVDSWERMSAAYGPGLDTAEAQRDRVAGLLSDLMVICNRIDADATARLLTKIRRLNKPHTRAAIRLAFPAPMHRDFVNAVLEEVS